MAAPFGDAPILCLVTDRLRRSDGRASIRELVERVGAAARAGVDLIQVRETGLSDRELVGLIERVQEVCAGTGARAIVNDRLDVALAAGAAGVHLKTSSVPSARARTLVPPGWLIGRSVHDVASARREAVGGGVDYLILGSIFETTSKPGRPGAGEGVLREVIGAVELPVLAIGGVTCANACAVARTGAAGVAGIGLFADGALGDMPAVVGALRRAFDSR